MAFVLTLADDGAASSVRHPTYIILTKENGTVIGKGEGCDLVLEGDEEALKFIAWRHCRLWVNENTGRPCIIGLGSPYGIYVNGLRIPEGTVVELQPRCSLSLGAMHAFTYSMEPADQQPPAEVNLVNTAGDLDCSFNQRNTSQSSLQTEGHSDEDLAAVWAESAGVFEEPPEILSNKGQTGRNQSHSEAQSSGDLVELNSLKRRYDLQDLELERLRAEIEVERRKSEESRTQLSKFKERIQNLVECPVCFMSKPSGMYVYRCGHILCDSCAKIIVSSGKLQCPTCRARLRDKTKCFVLDELSTLVQDESNEVKAVANVAPSGKRLKMAASPSAPQHRNANVRTAAALASAPIVDLT